MTTKGRMAIVLCLAVLMAFACTGLAVAQPADIQGHWAEQEISAWVSQGLSSGYADGSFKPDNPITRAEFITLVNRSFGFTETAEVDFADVLSTDWFSVEIAKAKAAGYISGYEDNTMRPDNVIVRQEVAAILVRLLGAGDVDETVLDDFVDAGAVQTWARPGVAAVVTSGLMKGYPDGTFLPESPITRAEALVSLQRALNSRQNGEIAGIVTQDGSPVQDALVRVYQAGSYKMLKEVVSDENGSYSCHLAPGRYDLTASTDDSVAYASSVMVKEDEVADGDLSLEPGTIASGVILNANGTKAAGAKVLFTTNPTFWTVTDSQGRYVIVLLPNHKYSVKFYPAGASDDEPVILADNLETKEAGEQIIRNLSPKETGSPVDIGNDGGGDGDGATDYTAPKINGASINIEGVPYGVTMASDGLSGSVDLSEVPDTVQLTTGTLTVSEKSKLVLHTRIPGIPEATVVNQELTSGDNELELFNVLSLVGPDGVYLSTVRALYGSSAIFEGTLTDEAGNVSNVSLTIGL